MSKIKLLLEQLELLVEKKDHLINRIDSLTPAQKDEIISFFQKYPQHESKINWNNINDLTYDDFKKVMQVPDTIPIKSGEAVEGTDYLEVDSMHKFHRAFIPLNWEGSKYLSSNAVGGMEGKWCIAYRESDEYWKHHFKNGVFIIYVTTKGKYAIKISRYDFTEIDSLWSKNNINIRAKGFGEETGNDALKLIEKNKKHFSHPNLHYSIFTPDFDGNIEVSRLNLTSLKGAPKEVKGYFFCTNNKLESLEGAPKKVEGNFYCDRNNLISLKGAPKEVGGDFDCDNNELENLEGAPDFVGVSFSCTDNNLKSLVGAPKEVGKGFFCSGNKLESLEGAPKKVKGNFHCNGNNLTSLKGAPETVLDDFSFDCSYNELTSLEGAPKKVDGYFACSNQKNGHKFTEEEVRAVCAVKGNVYV